MVTVDAPPSLSAPDRRRALALGLAIASVVIAVSAAALWVVTIGGLPERSGLAPVSIILGGALAPLLAVAAAVIVLRMRGTVSIARAVVLLVLAAIALPTAALAGLSWGLGFADADAGRPLTGLAAATVPLLLLALAAGAPLIGLLVYALCRSADLGEGGAALLGALCGLLGAPVLVWGLTNPTTSAALAVSALLLVALGTPRSRPERSIRPPAATRTATDRRPRERLAIALARLAAGAGVLGAVFALSGAAWWPVPIDGTEAMIVGISILLAAGMPLLASLALLVESRFPVAALLVRGPATALALALALALVAMGFWYTSAPDGDATGWAVSVASLFVGVAVGGMSFLLPLSRSVAIVVGLAVALALAAAQVAMLLPALAFGVPLVAIGILVLAARSERRLTALD